MSCERIIDEEMKAFKDITDRLNSADLPGKVYVVDNLKEFT